MPELSTARSLTHSHTQPPAISSLAHSLRQRPIHPRSSPFVFELGHACLLHSRSIKQVCATVQKRCCDRAWIPGCCTDQDVQDVASWSADLHPKIRMCKVQRCKVQRCKIAERASEGARSRLPLVYIGCALHTGSVRTGAHPLQGERGPQPPGMQEV